MRRSGSPQQPPGGTVVFNIQPCLRDPLFGLLKDRWHLSPLAGAALFLVVYLGGNLGSAWLSGTALPREGLDLPFAQDRVAWVLHAFLLPVGAFLALRFFGQVESSFERLYTEGVTQAPIEEYNAFLQRLHRLYNSVALHAVAFGLAALALGYLTLSNQFDGRRAWLDLDEGLGGIYQVATGLVAWYAVHIVLLKVVITAGVMPRVFEWPVSFQPLHPDGCGGFRLFTEIAVTIAFFTAATGTGVVLIVFAGAVRYGASVSTQPVLLALLLESLTPLVFVSCLYRAHQVMSANKEELLGQIHRAFQARFAAWHQSLRVGELPEEQVEEVLRLESLHGVIRRLPVWPTNTQMMAQVLVSVAVPLALLAVQLLLERAVHL